MKKILYILIVLVILSVIRFIVMKPKIDVWPEDKKIMERIENDMNILTLEEKIAQMFIISWSGSVVDDSLKGVLEQYRPGGFILFQDNFSTYENTVKFIKNIQATANIPMFISVDQEGGRVQRLSSLNDIEVTDIPAMSLVGKRNDISLAYDVGKVIGEELQVFGINMNFAPVIDVLSESYNTVIGDRSFGSNIDVVSDMGISLGKGLSDASVIPVYKHFPGHGSVVTDSHYALPVITKTKEELMSSDLVPFSKAIENGVDVIMIGHLAVLNIDREIPASLSKVMITDILKQEMGYEGLVITDALNMKAITNTYSEKEIYEMAIKAGVDLLLMPLDFPKAIELIKQSIEEGKITEEQIDVSVRKILKLKYTKLSNTYGSKDVLGNNLHESIIKKVLES